MELTPLTGCFFFLGQGPDVHLLARKGQEPTRQTADLGRPCGNVFSNAKSVWTTSEYWCNHKVNQNNIQYISILHKYTKIIRTGCEAYDRTSFDSVSWWAFYIYSLGHGWSLPSSLFWPADQWIVPSFEKHHRRSVTHTFAANWNFQSQTTLLEVHHQACLFGAGTIPGHNDEQEWIVISNSSIATVKV